MQALRQGGYDGPITAEPFMPQLGKMPADVMAILIGADKPEFALVLSPGTELTLRVLGSLDHVVLLLDGQDSVNLAAHDEIRVRLDKKSVAFVHNPERPFATSLQRKLGWQGSRKRSL